MGCSAQSPVAWSDMHQLALLIESVADAMNVPVTKLTTQTDSPFSLDSCPRLDAGYTFDIALGTTTVVDDWITTSFGRLATQWSPPNPAIAKLIDDEQAIFVHDEDSCWCHMGWWIRKSGGHFVLLQKEDAKCCPSVEVPRDVGEDNAWINSVAAKSHRMLEKRFQGNTYDEDIKRCSQDPSGEIFRMIVNGADDKGTVTYSLDMAHRIIDGYITWLIIPAYYDQLWNMIEQIIAGSCGARKERVRKAETQTYLCEFSIARTVDVLWTLQQGPLSDNEPGCIKEDGCSVTKPWETATCGGDFCDEKLKLYCRTLQDMETIANALSNLLYPKGTPPTCDGLLRCNSGPSDTKGGCSSGILFDRWVYSERTNDATIETQKDSVTMAEPEWSIAYPNLNETGIGPPSFCPWMTCDDATGEVYVTKLNWYHANNDDILRQLLREYGLSGTTVPSMIPACKKTWWLIYQWDASDGNSFAQHGFVFNLTHNIDDFARADTIAAPTDDYLAIDYTADTGEIWPCSYIHMERQSYWNTEDLLLELHGEVGRCGKLDTAYAEQHLPGWSGALKVDNYILGGGNCITWLIAPGNFLLLQCCRCGLPTGDPSGSVIDINTSCDTEGFPCQSEGSEC